MVIGEAGMHRTPTVAYAAAGGTRESVSDGSSGLLVAGEAAFTAAINRLLSDDQERARLGDGANLMSRQFTWQHAQESFAHVVSSALRGELIDSQDPDGD